MIVDNYYNVGAMFFTQLVFIVISGIIFYTGVELLPSACNFLLTSVDLDNLCDFSFLLSN